MKFYGSDSEINLERDGEREFSAFTWLPLDEIAAQVSTYKFLVTNNRGTKLFQFLQPGAWRLLLSSLPLRCAQCLANHLDAQVVEFKRAVYTEVAQEFCPIIQRMKQSSPNAS